jgi:hypothetical protein
VLESAAVCPGCKHHLRFSATALPVVESYCALSVDGTIQHRVPDEACEYCVVLSIRNERGESILRQVVGVGVLQPAETRSFNVSVDLLPARGAAAAGKRN